MPKYDDFELDVQQTEINDPSTNNAAHQVSTTYTDCPSVIKCKY